jgi:hypothetical protein
MLNLLLKLIPADWTWSVAAKKAAYMAGKGVAAILAFKKASLLSSHLTPEQQAQLQIAIGAVVAAGLEAIHDALKLHYPEASWL